MTILDRLEKKFGQYAIPNLTYYILGGQIIGFILTYANPQWDEYFILRGSSVLAGEWWRLVTVIFTPISMSPIFAAFAWYLYYIMGMALESQWGSFRYMVYLAIAYIGSVLSAFLFSTSGIGSTYIYISTFLAFAHLHPDFRLYLFFILPVKIKWLAILTWLGIGASVLFGSLSAKAGAIISVSNFLLFFGVEIFENLRDTSRRATRKSAASVSGLACAVCGTNDAIFYSCHDCAPMRYYCQIHIKDHEHKKIR